MAISIFCTGYATWTYTKATGGYASGTSMFTSYDTTPEDVEIGLDDFGITMTTAINGVGSAQTFQYKSITAGNTETEEFTSTTLSILFKINIEAMKNCELQDYRNESLRVTCAAAEFSSYLEGEGYEDPYIAKSFAANTDVGIWLAYSGAAFYVHGYPNVSRAVPITLDANGNLTMTVPLSELYNLLLPCEKGTVTENGAKYLPVILKIEFTPTGVNTPGSDSTRISRPCEWRYTYSAQLIPNA